MARLIDADKINYHDHTECMGHGDFETVRTVTDKEIAEIPTVETVEVVRCRECKYSTLPSLVTQRYGVPGTLTCHNHKSPCNKRNVKGECFCPYGERNDGDGNG